MALLRASSEAIGIEAGVDATIGGEDFGGVPAAAELVAFTEAVMSGVDLVEARARLKEATSDEAVVLAAMTVGAFNGLVRVADSTGIPADNGMLAFSADDRAALGLNSLPGKANSNLAAVPDVRPETVTGMFTAD